MLTKRDFEMVKSMILNEKKSTMKIVQPFNDTGFDNRQTILRTEIVCDRSEDCKGSVVGVGTTVAS